jgi:hypothetical protein
MWVAHCPIIENAAGGTREGEHRWINGVAYGMHTTPGVHHLLSLLLDLPDCLGPHSSLLPSLQLVFAIVDMGSNDVAVAVDIDSVILMMWPYVAVIVNMGGDVRCWQ